MVGVTLLHRRGYFYQRLDRAGWQSEEPVAWAIPDYAEPLEPRVSVEIEGRAVQVRAWRHLVTGMSGHTVPVYLLDTDLPDNSPWDRTITDSLYGGDAHYRLCQEMVLGFGGWTSVGLMLPMLIFGDLFAVVGPHLDGVLVPKIERPEELAPALLAAAPGIEPILAGELDGVSAGTTEGGR